MCRVFHVVSWKQTQEPQGDIALTEHSGPLLLHIQTWSSRVVSLQIITLFFSSGTKLYPPLQRTLHSVVQYDDLLAHTFDWQWGVDYAASNVSLVAYQRYCLSLGGIWVSTFTLEGQLADTAMCLWWHQYAVAHTCEVILTESAFPTHLFLHTFFWLLSFFFFFLKTYAHTAHAKCFPKLGPVCESRTRQGQGKKKCCWCCNRNFLFDLAVA